jgi:hypothetical protein
MTLGCRGSTNEFGTNRNAYSSFEAECHFGRAFVTKPEELQTARRLFDGVFVAGLFKSLISGSFDSEQFTFVEV